MKRILIANRGEIAVRIIRTCKMMGIETVAVYSEADEQALHVSMADHAVCIGGALSKNSYLNHEAIISAALAYDCQGIHPGFGFLSENAEFARKVIAQNITFIGPNPNLIDCLGDKANARQTMIEAGVPVVPGSQQVIQSLDELQAMVETMGFPVIIKASAGGGGKGMRMVFKSEELSNAYQQAQSEALSAFGNGDVYVEKYLVNPKHVEVQLAADQHGNVIHLFERDCSLQRKHQKILEETPCHTLDESTRQQLLQDAVKAAKHVGYDSVGTIEFLLDQNQQYYFMEMNTRIQVEHTITEMITGIDLIKVQIQSAMGLPLEFQQTEIKCDGVAIECRINAEDVNHDFRPSPGLISAYHAPGGKDVRIESAIYAGYNIPPFYDSMILKLITWGPNRLACIRRMRIALEELLIEGITTNLEFQYYLLHHQKVLGGKYHTGTLECIIKELKDHGTVI
jgi:acetyl-CoA carboxylase, biotin carboxylase subunit